MNTSPLRARATGSVRAAGALVTPARLLLAGKTAGAAVLAWYLAPLIPFAADEYSYYAPLGVVVSMYPTLADSARAGLQTLLGLAAGLGLGLVAVGLNAAGVPAAVALAAIVLVGVVLGGMRSLGPGRDWIAMAALFVLLIGGRTDAETYSVSYLVTLAFGVVVGVVVNIVIAPADFLPHAVRRLGELRDTVAVRMDEMADAVAAGAADDESLAEAMGQLTLLVDEVADEVREADRSRRGNPRGRRHAAEHAQSAQRMRALERVTFFVRDLADVLAHLRADDAALRGESRGRLVDAIRACRDVVMTAPGHEEAAKRLAAASEATECYLSALEPAETDAVEVAELATAGVCLRRIIDACRPFT